MLGVALEPVEHAPTGRSYQWAGTFHLLDVTLDPCCICDVFTDTDTWDAYIESNKVAEDLPLDDCIAAIERELLAIKQAIPDPITKAESETL